MSINKTGDSQEISYLPVRLGKHEVRIKSKNGEDYCSMESMAEALVEYIKEEYVEGLSTLALNVTEARGLIDESVAGAGSAIESFEQDIKSNISKIRTARMGITSELKQILSGLRDVREFFLGKDYSEQTKRLEEFVEVCERLRVLKESGFLDDIADTLLKLDN